MSFASTGNKVQPFPMPQAPAEETGAVKAWSEAVSIPTYEPDAADPFPSFLEHRVYQGSSGKVYPLPVIERIASEPVPHLWQAIHLENEYLRLMVLPQIGGRIHVGFDKTNGYDFFYRQNVIKPALVGLAGPWVSGGVEFNWPQHHRPATYMPCETAIERGADGSITVWCSQHDPLSHMKGMHGVCLHPGRAVVELKARLYNRTEAVQTFLWWANVATRVHQHYQSFFPPDVRFVADHAKRAVTSFPASDRPYYGVDYPARAAHGVPPAEQPAHFCPDGSYPADDLSWYANIPVPTSYMITSTADDFFGGYDHALQAGVVHVANHHIAPGKKQWTWGNQEFGYAWDRCLTDPDSDGVCAPYIELMAGVYTDNQPDFSFLAPGETKTFSQFWYPIRKLGVPQAANLQAALSLTNEANSVRIGVCVTAPLAGARLTLQAGETVLSEWAADLSVESPLLVSLALPEGVVFESLQAVLRVAGETILSYSPGEVVPAPAPEPATEPPPPAQVESVEELYLTALHLQQYRHATRSPEPYWREALVRDPGDSRSNTALGVYHLNRGEFARAETHLLTAIKRLTRRNPNPYDGEAHYQLGLVLRYQRRETEAYAAFYKSAWNAAWRAPAYRALAEMDASRGHWPTCLDHAQRSLRADADNPGVQALLAVALRHLGRPDEAAAQLQSTLELDPLHALARHLANGALPADGQTRLDLAFDYARMGLYEAAIEVCSAELAPAKDDGSIPMLHYTRAVLLGQAGDSYAATNAVKLAATLSPAYVFPSRLEELQVLESAIALNPSDSRAPLYLGNLLYDRRRYDEAIACWQAAVALEPSLTVAHRNLGIAFFNVRGEQGSALSAYDLAFATDQANPRILYERDQLWKRTGVAPSARLSEFEKHPALIAKRDDLSVEMAALLNFNGQPQLALDLLLSRNFQPWEGGEGLVLAQFVRSNILLAQHALSAQQPERARALLTTTLAPPRSLGETWHPLANQSEPLCWLGRAFAAEGRLDEAREAWQHGAQNNADFQQMALAEISENTFWVASCLQALSEHGPNADRATMLFQKIDDFSLELEQQRPVVDYFATSLPTMLLFHEDLSKRNQLRALYLRAQAAFGLRQIQVAQKLASDLLARDPSHAGASDLLRLLPAVIQS